MDPRVRLQGVSADLLGQLTASFSEHVKWLEGQLEEAGSRRRAGYSHDAQSSNSQHKATTPWQNLLKSPARQRITDKTNVTRTGVVNHLSSTSVAPPSSNIFGSPRAVPQNKQRPTGTAPSLFRSPGKVGLNAAAKSPIQQQQSRHLDTEESDKENSLAKSTRSTTATVNHNKPKSTLNTTQGNGAAPSSLRSPGGRAVLGASASRQQQPQSPAATRASQQVAASPTPRPSSRIVKSPLNNQTKNVKSAAVSETPVKVVDDVFMLGSEGLQDTAVEDVQNEEEDEDDDDDDEVADILLGYAKTPAQASKTGHNNSNASAKALPAIPVTLSALHTSPPGRSPPRPAKSPARPSPTHAQPQPVPLPNANSPITSKMPSSVNTSKLPGIAPASSAMHSGRAPASPRPAPRNMSDLASIASVLGSPMKASSIPSQSQPIATFPQIPANIIQAARAIPALANRPSSPAPGTASPSRVPIPSTSNHLKSPSQATSASASAAPRVRSPLMSDKISYFQSVSQKDLTKPMSPPTRASSRLAGMASPPVSPRVGSPVPSAFSGNRQLVPPSSPRLGGIISSMMPKSPRMQQVKQMAQQVEEKTKSEMVAAPAILEIKQVEEVARPTSPAPGSTAMKSPRRPQLSPVQSTTTSPARNAIISPVQQKEMETFKSPADRRKVTIPTPPAKSPLRAQLQEAAKQAIEAAVSLEKGENKEKEKDEEPVAASAAVKAKDFAEVEPASKVLPAGVIKDREAEKEVSQPVEVEVPIKEAPASSSTTRHIPLAQSTSSGTNIPPSPVFSSFLSNPNRTSALSFVGLPGRSLGSGHNREKSLGLGLGLGKSLSAANAARVGKEAQHSQQDSDSQGSSNNGQSFHSALSGGKKRLSSALTEQIDSQGSTTSKLARTESITTASSARTSISVSTMQQSQVPPTSKGDATKAKLDMLRSRISNFKGVAGTNGARISSISSVQSFNAAVPTNHVQAPTVPAQSRFSVYSGEQTGLFSPLAAAPATSTVQSEDVARPKEVSLSATTQSAASTLSSAIASFVPAPSFSASFANLFGASFSKPLPPMSSPPKEKDPTLPKPASAGIYPSLPSMTNLAAPSSPVKEKRALSVEPGDEDMEELAETQKSPEQKESRSRRSSTSSVHDIVEAFEAKTASVTAEKERLATTSPVQRRISSTINIPQAAPLTMQPVTSTVPVFRSTTPPFSPPAVQTNRATSIASTRASMSSLGEGGRLPIDPGHTDELAIEDPDVEPIARASSVGTEAAETEIEDAGVNVSDMDTPPRVLSSQQSQPVRAEPAVISESIRQQTEERQMKEQALPQAFKPTLTASTLARSTNASTFKPTRPVIEVIEPARPSKSTIARPLSRAPSVSSLAPSRASTVSVASTASYNPNKSTNGSSLSKKTGLGSSMSGKPEVKSLQMAAAVAKKEQAEKDHKAALKNERDQKRASVIVTKKDDMVDGEKKRKERDELSQGQSQGYSQSSQGSTLATAKGKAPMVKPKPATTSSGKTDDEPAKKRKMDVEVVVTKTAVKKTTVIRPAQPKASTSNNLASSSSRAPAPSSSQPSAHSKALAASASMIGVVKQASSSQPSRPLQASTSRAPLQPAKTVAQQALLSQHQQAMSALGKSQVSRLASSQQPSSKPLPPIEPEPELFELPEVDSEYSDSDEEEQAKRAAARPDWTQSPALRQALSMQATFDPDDLFGEIPTLRMEEMFQQKSTAARLRFRTSSAHWSGPDALSKYEEQEYARRMGFTSNQR